MFSNDLAMIYLLTFVFNIGSVSRNYVIALACSWGMFTTSCGTGND